MVFADWFALSVIGLSWGAQILLRSSAFSRLPINAVSDEGGSESRNLLRRMLQWIRMDGWPGITEILFWFSVVFIFLSVARDAMLQYDAWSAGGIGKFLLPPFQPQSYFLYYTGVRMFAPWLIALLGTILVSGAALRLNRRYGERFFEPEEIGFMRIGMFLSGYPGFLFYLLIVLASELFLSAFYTLAKGGRAPLYFWWLPLAILAIILRNYAGLNGVIPYFNL